MASPPEIDSAGRPGKHAGASSRIALDGHVHIQKDMPYAAIAENFARSAPDHLPLCVIVECAGIDRFQDLVAECEPWGEFGLHDQQTRLYFLAGRQVVSAEGLEILLIGFRDQKLEGLPADRVIATGLDRGAAVCLPWGFGKWLGSRRELAASLHARSSRQVMLGDIANRPGLWREPLFTGERVLRGSDNLPLPGSSNGVGTFGSVLETGTAIDSADTVVAMLRNGDVPLKPYGKRKGLVASFSEQLRLRTAKGEA